MDEDTLVGPKVAEVEQHHVGGDVVDREGCCVLKAHAFWDEEGVGCWYHCHLLPQPKAAQHHHLITNLEQKAGGETRGKNKGKSKDSRSVLTEKIRIISHLTTLEKW